ncbi:MAG: glycosyltransferase family 2 protein [Thiogranum sp.]|nr:glycosyltransferase family 2 protein [Thiogranum sp.]
MPVHDGEEYIREAINSVLGQTFPDFELLIINDGSSDRSVEIIESFADQRIRLLHNTRNEGIEESLNRGIQAAQGVYLVRMDYDDICVSTRLENLVDFMNGHPEIGICGSFIKTIGASVRTWSFPCEDREIRCRLLFESCIPHPSAIIRMSEIARHQLRYDTRHLRAEDYDFWVRCSEHMQLANYPEVLLHYRIHEKQIGSLHLEAQQEAADRVRERLLKSLGVSVTPESLSLHRAISTWRLGNNPELLRRVDDWLRTLLSANCRTGIFPEPEFSRELASRLYRACYTSTGGSGAWKTWRESPFSGHLMASPIATLKLFLRCAFDHAAS